MYNECRVAWFMRFSTKHCREKKSDLCRRSEKEGRAVGFRRLKPIGGGGYLSTKATELIVQGRGSTSADAAVLRRKPHCPVDHCSCELRYGKLACVD